VLADRGDQAGFAAVSDEVLASHRALVARAGDAPGALRSMTAAMRTIAESRDRLGDREGACTLWRGALANFATLEARGSLSDFDRNNGLPETRGLVADRC
jgi:hypothetical protein